MLARIGAYEYDLEQGFAICIPFHQGPDQVNCYYAPPFSVSPVVMGDFTGEISSGAPVNYRNISVNPHGNGTHTECLAHISDADLDVHAALTDSFFPVQVLTIAPHRLTNGDQVLRFREAEILPEIKALAIRSCPIHQTSNTEPIPAPIRLIWMPLVWLCCLTWVLIICSLICLRLTRRKMVVPWLPTKLSGILLPLKERMQP